LKQQSNIAERIERLFETEDWSDGDKIWVLQYLQTTDHAELRSLMEEKFESESSTPLSAADKMRLLSSIHQQLDAGKARSNVLYLKKTHILSIAASIIFILGLAITWSLIGNDKQKNDPVTASATQQLQNDRAPGRDNAILTLADGSVIVLEDAANGTLAQQGAANVVKVNGTISYDPTAVSDEVLYNTISTAKGNQYQLILADGSKVWLNASSSLRFPTAFDGNERRVEITGEAYFEVARNAAKPFIVSYSSAGNDKGEVQVLGTHFNINSYADETEVKTTLVEGKVNVKHGGASVLLLPAQEAVFNKTGKQFKVNPADVEEAIAWKTGMFEFRDADLPAIMRQISRWYDVEIQYIGHVSSKQYNGAIRRQATLIQVLEILKQAGVSFTLNGKQLTVRST
jgi:transmembrane sensor